MEDIIGRRFGRLFVVDYAKKVNGKDYWVCRCQCGKYREIQRRHLKSGATQSCGCLRNERVKEAIFKDLTGKKFGKLLVLSLTGKRRRGYYWRCLCDCGNIIDVVSSALASGNTKSCGCLHKEVASQVNKERKQYNQYRFEGDIGIGICSDGTEFLFDREDYDKIKDYQWYCNQGYIRGELERKHFSIHRVIMGLSKDSDIFVDHTEGNPLDNRKKFLRLATPSQNCQNRKNSSTNTTGMAGVSLQKETGKYMVRIGVDKERLYLGLYSTYEEAVKVRLEAEKKYYGDYARDLKYR